MPSMTSQFKALIAKNDDLNYQRGVLDAYMIYLADGGQFVKHREHEAKAAIDLGIVSPDDVLRWGGVPAQEQAEPEIGSPEKDRCGEPVTRTPGSIPRVVYCALDEGHETKRHDDGHGTSWESE